MARDGDDRLASITLLAAQTDFQEPGELSLFIDESQVTLLEDMMWDQGYLSSDQMAGAFRLLNSQDLIWSRLVRNYLLGRRIEMTDLMAWNADATRMPFRMHSEYLRAILLNNDLAEGRFPVRGKPVALADVRVPLFVVATTTDHISPWSSVFKIHLLADTELTFVLTKGGPQCRHRERTRSCRPLLPANDLSCRHALQTARRMVRNGATPRWLLVASLARVARPTFRAARGAALARRPRKRLSAAR